MTKKTVCAFLLALAVSAGASAFVSKEKPTFTPTPFIVDGIARTPHTFSIPLHDTKGDFEQISLEGYPDIAKAVKVDVTVINEGKQAFTITVQGGDGGGSILHFYGGHRYFQDVGIAAMLNWKTNGGSGTAYITWWT